jgi:hypothetical protein
MQETTIRKTRAEKACHFFSKSWVLIAEQPLMTVEMWLDE